MWDIKACAVCFSTEVQLHDLDDALRAEFNTVSGLQTINGNGMPEYLCWECRAYVKKFIKFRARCHRAHYVLQQMLLKDKEIKLSHLTLINRHQLKLMPTLSYLPVVQYVTGRDQQNVKNQVETLQTEFKIEIEPNEITNSTPNNTEYQDNSKKRLLLPEQSFGSQTSKLRQALEASIPIHQSFGTQTTKPFDELDESNKIESDNALDTFDNVDSDNENFDQLSYYLENDKSHQEYADAVPITTEESVAVMEVFKYSSSGDYECSCGMRYNKESSYMKHLRRHDKHLNGEYHCEICNVYFKTESLLNCHLNDHHLFKYLCKKCPHVNFTRVSAKQHYILTHMQNGTHMQNKWEVLKKPKWLSNKGGKRTKTVIAKPPTYPSKMKKVKKLPSDYLIYSPISQEDQYKIVEQRKQSRNYLESKYRCELCFRGYRLTDTYNKHMLKHDPNKAGKLQCDMCKLYFPNTRKMYKHMISYHLFKYSCQHCDFVCYSKCLALYHYRWHNNVVYDCPHCDKRFNKISTQLTHIRYKHPSTDLCNLCGHSFISISGLNCHKQMSHTKEEIEISTLLSSSTDPSAEYYCSACDMQFYNEAAYTTHLASSSKHVDINLAVQRSESARSRKDRARRPPPRAGPGAPGTGARGPRGRPRRALVGSEILNNGITTANNCEVCGMFLSNDVVARKHYDSEHPGTDYLKRYMCDVCGHTTKQYANLLVHMRVHTLEKPYECPHCDRKFSLPSNRDRHLVVHTGEKRYQCQHCSRRFTQSTAVKLHIQTVHMKIPYKPWDKKNRKRRKEMEPTTQTSINAVLGQPPAPLPQQKILLDPQTEYITYIAYAEQ